MKRVDVYTEARKWIGTPYLHQGRTKHGIDCVGLIQKVGDALGVPYVDRNDYGRSPDAHKLMAHLYKYLHQAKIDGDKPGLLGVFRETIRPCHTGIFGLDAYGNITVIHARADIRKVVEEVFINGHNKLNLVNVLAMPGLEDL